MGLESKSAYDIWISPLIKVLREIRDAIRGNYSKEMINDDIVALDSTWSSDKIEQSIGSITNTINQEIANKDIIDVKFTNHIPSSAGEENEYMVYRNDNEDILYQYIIEDEVGIWKQVPPLADSLYFNLDNELIYSYDSVNKKFVEVALENTYIINGSVNSVSAKTVLDNIRNFGVYNVIQHTVANGKTRLTNLTLTVQSADREEWDNSVIYQKLENNVTIYKRTSNKITGNFGNFSTYYEGLVNDRLDTSKYYTWSIDKLKNTFASIEGGGGKIKYAGDGLLLVTTEETEDTVRADYTRLLRHGHNKLNDSDKDLYIEIDESDDNDETITSYVRVKKGHAALEGYSNNNNQYWLNYVFSADKILFEKTRYDIENSSEVLQSKLKMGDNIEFAAEKKFTVHSNSVYITPDSKIEITTTNAKIYGSGTISLEASDIKLIDDNAIVSGRFKSSGITFNSYRFDFWDTERNSKFTISPEGLQYTPKSEDDEENIKLKITKSDGFEIKGKNMYDDGINDPIVYYNSILGVTGDVLTLENGDEYPNGYIYIGNKTIDDGGNRFYITTDGTLHLFNNIWKDIDGEYQYVINERMNIVDDGAIYITAIDGLGNSDGEMHSESLQSMLAQLIAGGGGGGTAPFSTVTSPIEIANDDLGLISYARNIVFNIYGDLLNDTTNAVLNIGVYSDLEKVELELITDDAIDQHEQRTILLHHRSPIILVSVTLKDGAYNWYYNQDSPINDIYLNDYNYETINSNIQKRILYVDNNRVTFICRLPDLLNYTQINHERSNVNEIIYLMDIGIMPTCFVKGTKITLSDGTTKNVEDVTYDDSLKVWNFDEAIDDSAKPIWIQKVKKSKSYHKVTLENGIIFNTVGGDKKYHCMYDVTEQKFNHATECVGHEIYTLQGVSKVLYVEEIKEEVEFYNILTNYHLNCYANNILVSSEINNIYPIQNMKFVKDDRELKDYKDFEKYEQVPKKYFDGFRFAEQPRDKKYLVEFSAKRFYSAK